MKPEKARAALCARLRFRREEIEASVTARVRAVAGTTESENPEYVHGLFDSFTAAVEYDLGAIEPGVRRAPPLPPVLADQTRVAARNGVGLDTILRRYLAGYALLIEHAIGEAEASGLIGEIGLRELLRGQATLCDRLLADASSAYTREASERLSSLERRRAERVKRLLGGELLDTSDLGYDLDAWHLGVIASGFEAASATRELAGFLGCHMLLVYSRPETVWAWLGSRGPFKAAELERLSRPILPPRLSVAIGEPARGLLGWRFTHRQASAAFSVALRGPSNPVRYAKSALLASMLRDDLLTTSLRELFLVPLEQERNGGQVLLETLRTYFATDRNISSAAAALGVTRRTVSNRLRAAETRLGCSLPSVAAEIEAALRLQGMQSASRAAVRTAERNCEDSALQETAR